MGVIHNKEAIESLKKTAASLQEQINNIDPGGGPTVTVTDISEGLIMPTGVTLVSALKQTYGNIIMLSFIMTIEPGASFNDVLYVIPDNELPITDTAWFVMPGTEVIWIAPVDDKLSVSADTDLEYVAMNVMWLINPPVTPGE